MQIDKLVLILACVGIAAAATLWLSVLVLTALSLPFAWLALLPAALMGYVVYKVIAERVGNAEEDHYDGLDH